MLTDYKVIKVSSRGDKTSSYLVQKKGTNIYDQIKIQNSEKIYELGEYVNENHLDYIANKKIYKDYQKINCNEEQIIISNLNEIADFIQESYKNSDFLKNKLLPKKIQKEDQNPNHSSCDGKISKDRKEKPICRCMYYYNSNKNSKKICNQCALEKWRNKSKDVNILEYEYPTTKKYKNVGGIDLILEYKNQIYATEVKPKTSRETLPRMFAEILTYTQDTEKLEEQDFMKGRKPRPAICFFEGSKQHKAFIKYKTELQEPMAIICKKIFTFIVKTESNEEGIIDFIIEPNKD